MTNSNYGGSAEEAGWHQPPRRTVRIIVAGSVVWQDKSYFSKGICAECKKTGPDCSCGITAPRKDC